MCCRVVTGLREHFYKTLTIRTKSILQISIFTHSRHKILNLQQTANLTCILLKKQVSVSWTSFWIRSKSLIFRSNSTTPKFHDYVSSSKKSKEHLPQIRRGAFVFFSMNAFIGYIQIEFFLQRNMFGMMLARLDEFESLTPLMVTPASSDEASSVRHPRIPTIASQSPPPPRRSTNGKTLIVPLNSPRGLLWWIMQFVGS